MNLKFILKITQYSVLILPISAAIILALAACQQADTGKPEPASNPDHGQTPLPVCYTPTTFMPDSQAGEDTASLSPTQTPESIEPACQETKGRVEVREIAVDVLPHPLKFRIYLPPCFGSQQKTRYPLLILLHGQGFNDDQWDRLGLDEAADAMINSGEAPQFIAVMPFEEYHLLSPQESGFGTAIINMMIPTVDLNYSTCSERNCRAIGGISRGAAWAMHLGMTNWQVFNAIGAHSFPPFGGDVYQLPYWVQAIPAEQQPHIYIDIGVNDQYYEPAAGFEAQLTQLRVPHSWTLWPGSHDETYWQSHIKDYLRWYVQAWKK